MTNYHGFLHDKITDPSMNKVMDIRSTDPNTPHFQKYFCKKINIYNYCEYIFNYCEANIDKLKYSHLLLLKFESVNTDFHIDEVYIKIS